MDDISITKVKQLVGVPRSTRQHDELIETISHTVTRLCFLSIREVFLNNPRLRKLLTDAIANCVAGKVILELVHNDGLPLTRFIDGEVLKDKGVHQLDPYLSGAGAITEMLIDEVVLRELHDEPGAWP